MTTREFMRSRQGHNPSREVWCSSVKQSTNGDFYSYGSHYPLLFKVGSLWFVNDNGYSSSTSKHICWARPFANHSVELPNNQQYGTPKIEYVLECLNSELKRLKDELNKHRNGTQIANRISDHIEETLKDIKAIKKELKN